MGIPSTVGRTHPYWHRGAWTDSSTQNYTSGSQDMPCCPRRAQVASRIGGLSDGNLLDFHPEGWNLPWCPRTVWKAPAKLNVLLVLLTGAAAEAAQLLWAKCPAVPCALGMVTVPRLVWEGARADSRPATSSNGPCSASPPGDRSKTWMKW